MLLLWTVSVENVMGYDDIVSEFAPCTFSLRGQPTKRERVLKSKLWKTFVCICLLYVHDENQINVFIYSIHPGCPVFNIKMIEIYTL